MVVNFSNMLDLICSSENEDTKSLQTSYHMINCILTNKTNSPSLDKVHDSRMDLLNSAVRRIQNIFASENSILMDLSVQLGDEMGNLLERKMECDTQSMQLVGQMLALICNLLDGLVKPEDFNQFDTEQFMQLVQLILNEQTYRNRQVIQNFIMLKKMLLQSILVFYKEMTTQIFSKQQIDAQYSINIIIINKSHTDTIDEFLQSISLLGLEAIQSIINFASEEDIFLLIDRLLMDYKCPLVDMIELNPDFMFTKIALNVISHCMKTNSSIFSLDETYFDESIRVINRKFLVCINKYCLLIPKNENFTKQLKIQNSNPEFTQHFQNYRIYQYDQYGLEFIEEFISNLSNNFNNSAIEYDYMIFLKDLINNLIDFIVCLKNQNQTKIYKINDSNYLIKKILQILTHIFQFKIYDLLPLQLDIRIMDHFYTQMNNLVKKQFSSQQDEYNPYQYSQVEITHSESVFLQSQTKQFRHVLDLDQTHAMLTLRNEDQMIKLLTFTEKLLDFEDKQVKNNILDLYVIMLNYNSSKVYEFISSQELSEKMQTNIDQFDANRNLNVLEDFYNDPYNFKTEDRVHTWLIIKNEINNTNDGNEENPTNNASKRNSIVENKPKRNSSVENSQINPETINIPSESNNFKRSRERSSSRNNKDFYADNKLSRLNSNSISQKQENKENANSNTNSKEQKELPPISKKNKKDPRIMEIINNSTQIHQSDINEDMLLENSSKNSFYENHSNNEMGKSDYEIQNGLEKNASNLEQEKQTRRTSNGSNGSKSTKQRPKSGKGVMRKQITTDKVIEPTQPHPNTQVSSANHNNQVDESQETPVNQSLNHNKDILFGQTLENFQNSNIDERPASKNRNLQALLTMFPQLKNLDHNTLLSLLQQNNSSSLDTEGRVIYNQTIQSFYKDKDSKTDKYNTVPMDSNFFSNEFNTLEHTNTFTNANSNFNTDHDFFPQPKQDQQNIQVPENNIEFNSPVNNYEQKNINMEGQEQQSKQIEQDSKSNLQKLNHSIQDDNDVEQYNHQNLDYENYMYKQISMKDIIDENQKNRYIEQANATNKSILDRVDKANGKEFVPLIRNKEALKKATDTDVMRLGVRNTSSKVLLNPRDKDKARTEVTSAITNSNASTNERSAEIRKDDSDKKKKQVFKVVMKVQFADQRDVDDLLMPDLFHAYFAETLCSNKEEKVFTKKLRIKLGINQTQGQMIPKKLGIKKFSEMVAFFIKVVNAEGMVAVNDQIQQVLSGMTNCEKLLGILGNVAMKAQNQKIGHDQPELNQDILRDIKLGFWKNLDEEIAENVI